jgi:hypothetical protein
MKKSLVFVVLSALVALLSGCAVPMYTQGPVVSGGGWVQTHTPAWTPSRQVWSHPVPVYGGHFPAPVYTPPPVQYGYPQGGGLTNPGFWYNTNQGLIMEMRRSCNAPPAVCQGAFYRMDQAPRF